MSKHTPGPWSAAIDECATVRDSRDNQLAMVTYLFTKTGGRRNGDEVSANASLIAAAPELLEALEHVIDRFMPCRDDYIFSKRAALDKAAAAIAKAKGEQ